jgi:hypothetical protein
MSKAFLVLFTFLSCAKPGSVALQPVSDPSLLSNKFISFWAVDQSDGSRKQLQNLDVAIWHFTDELDSGELAGLQSGFSNWLGKPDFSFQIREGKGLDPSALVGVQPGHWLIVRYRLLEGISGVGENGYNVRWTQFHFQDSEAKWVVFTDFLRAGL